MQLESIKNLTKENSFKNFKMEGEPVVLFGKRENYFFISQIMNIYVVSNFAWSSRGHFHS